MFKTDSQLNTIHLEWARSHDWGRDAKLEAGCIVLTETYSQGGVEKSRVLFFETFNSLKIWAGY